MLKQTTQLAIAVYFLLMVGVLYAGIQGNTVLGLITKPLLMPTLIFIVWHQGLNKIYKNNIIPALFFSFVGDTLLMFQTQSSLYFILGLVAFLLAHVFYIRFFAKLIISASHPVKKKPIFMGLILLYCAALYAYLYPHLGGLRWPVLLYAVIISLMLLLSINAFNSVARKPAIRFVAGAVLFVLSDSILAINKFRTPIPYGGLWIMLTYCLAQYYLVKGALMLYRSN